jgi:hypothetical protein
VSNQPSAVLSSPSALNTLAPDLVAVFFGAQPHPDIVIPRPQVTVADLAAAARAAAPDSVTFEWDGPGQRLKG